ncbi:hypothetical protein WAI453_005632 [Rhynchosporium graminicola]
MSRESFEQTEQTPEQLASSFSRISTRATVLVAKRASIKAPISPSVGKFSNSIPHNLQSQNSFPFVHLPISLLPSNYAIPHSLKAAGQTKSIHAPTKTKARSRIHTAKELPSKERLHPQPESTSKETNQGAVALLTNLLRREWNEGLPPDRNLGRQDPTKRMSNRHIDSLHAAELISLAKLFVSQWCDLEAQKVKNEHKKNENQTRQMEIDRVMQDKLADYGRHANDQKHQRFMIVWCTVGLFAGSVIAIYLESFILGLAVASVFTLFYDAYNRNSATEVAD